MPRTLYHYVHCPFCVRVRMTLGLLRLEFESRVLPYDDETTPLRLTGTKMLPILVEEGAAMNESLDIMAHLDSKNVLKLSELKKGADFPEFEAYLNFLGGYVHSLAMPYWIWTPEFNSSSREYFKKKKEVKRGPFHLLAQKKDQFIDSLKPEWKKLEAELTPFYRSDALTAKDLLLAAHVWGLYAVPEFQFPDKIHAYLQKVKFLCNFNYHEDFWRKV